MKKDDWFEKLVCNLRNTGEAMMELAERLTNGPGERLDDFEKGLCRMASMSIIDDLFARAKGDFMGGRHPDYINDYFIEVMEVMNRINGKMK